MNCLHAPVNLEKVDFSDRTFSIRRFGGSDALDRSLDRHGILSPPWVLSEGNGRFTVVDGFRRLHWARERRIERVDCLVFPAGSDRAELLLGRIESGLFGAPPDPAEKAQIVSKLAALVSVERFLAEFAGRLGVASRPEAVSAWCRVAEAGEGLLDAMAAGNVSERVALEVATWDEPDRDAMVSLLKVLRCSSSIQFEIAERVDEIARQQDRHPREVLADAELGRIGADPGSNRRQKTQGVRDVLRRRRFPRLSARVERVAAELADASLPAGVEIVPPPSFEGEDWQLKITFSNPEQLRARLEAALDFARSPHPERLMDRNTSGRKE